MVLNVFTCLSPSLPILVPYLSLRTIKLSGVAHCSVAEQARHKVSTQCGLISECMTTTAENTDSKGWSWGDAKVSWGLFLMETLQLSTLEPTNVASFLQENADVPWGVLSGMEENDLEWCLKHPQRWTLGRGKYCQKAEENGWEAQQPAGANWFSEMTGAARMSKNQGDTACCLPESRYPCKEDNVQPVSTHHSPRGRRTQ